MRKKNTYNYEMDGVVEGPYLFEQIVGLATSGLIKADAKIDCVETGEKLNLRDFFDTLSSESNAVSVVDVEMKFLSVADLMLKCVIASIPVAIVLFVLSIFAQGFLFQLLKG